MRILITKDGLKEFQDSDDWSSVKSNTNREHSSSSKKKTMSLSNIQSLKKSSRFNRKLSVPLKPKVIYIKQNPIQVTEELKSIYCNQSNQIETQSPIVLQIPDVFMSMQSSHSSSSLPKLKESYSLKEIIPESCFEKLDKKIKDKQQFLYHHTILDDKMFRNDSIGKRQIVFDKITTNKESTIDCKNIKLMEYLTGKTTISNHLLHNLASYDTDRVDRLNKICQKMLSRKETEELYQKELKNRNDFQRIYEQAKAFQDSLILDQKIDSSLKMIKKYSAIPIDIKNNYKNIHSQFKNRYWGKDKYDRYYYPHSMRKNKLCYHIALHKDNIPKVNE